MTLLDLSYSIQFSEPLIAMRSCPVIMADAVHMNPVRNRLVALVSCSLCTRVASGGRYIGFP